MLHPDFKNGQKLDLQSALAVFVMMMGFLFLIEAAPGAHTWVALLTLLAGLVWLTGHESVQRWWLRHHPPVSRPPAAPPLPEIRR